MLSRLDIEAEAVVVVVAAAASYDADRLWRDDTSVCRAGIGPAEGGDELPAAAGPTELRPFEV